MDAPAFLSALRQAVAAKRYVAAARLLCAEPRPADLPRGWMQEFAPLIDALFMFGLMDEAVAVLRALRSPMADEVALRRAPYLATSDPDAVAALRRAYNQRHAVPVDRPAQTRPIDLSRPLVVGHLLNSAGFSSAEFFLAAERRRHDRSKVRLIHYLQKPGAPTEVHPDDLWVDCAGLSDEQLFDRIVADGVDILVDHCDVNGGKRLSLLAARAAPVQIHRGGLMSSQLATMDWKHSDAVIGDASALRERWSERLFTLPVVQCYAPPPDAPPPSDRRPDPAAIRFGAYCQPGKIQPVVAQVWARILAAVPGSTLVLKRKEFSLPDAVERVAERLTKAGAPATALRFARYSDKANHLAHYGEVDVCLDPFPFGGHTTTCESLWMGTPVVALLGTTWCARLGPAYLTAAGCGAWVASDPDDYVRIALELVADPARLHQIRQGLRTKVAASTLCDGLGFTRALEDAYRQIAEDSNVRLHHQTS